MPVSIGSDEATTSILSDRPRTKYDTAGVFLGVEDGVFRSNRLRVKDDSPAASSETLATVPVSIGSDEAMTAILSDRLTTKDDAAGVSSSDAAGLLRSDRPRAKDDSHRASSKTEATVHPSIPRDAATAPILPEGVAPTFLDSLWTKNITPGEMLTDEADESILFLRPHGRRTMDDSSSAPSTSTTTSQEVASAHPGQMKDGAAAAHLFANDSTTGDETASSVGHTTQPIHGKHVRCAPPLKPTKDVRVLFPFESRGASNLPATDVGKDIRSI